MRTPYILPFVIFITLLVTNPNTAYAQSVTLETSAVNIKGKTWGRVLTPNFAVYYDLNRNEDFYAKDIASYLEVAWRIVFNRLQYRQPRWTKKYRVSVWIKDMKPKLARKPTLGETATGYLPIAIQAAQAVPWHTATKRGKTRPYIEFNTEERLRQMKLDKNLLPVVALHEFFHIVQFDYCFEQHGESWRCPEWQHDWLFEGTAKWIETQVLPYNKNTHNHWFSYGWLSQVPGWGNSKRYGLSPTHKTNAYAMSYFLEFLTARELKKPDAVRNLWTWIWRTSWEDAYKGLQRAAGGPDKLMQHYARFGVAAYIMQPQHHAHFSLPAFADVTIPRNHADAWPLMDALPTWEIYKPGWSMDIGNGRIRQPEKIKEYKVEPLGLSFRDGGVSADSTLLLAIRGKEDNKWAFNLITEPATKANKSWSYNVTQLRPTNNKFASIRLNGRDVEKVALVTTRLQWPPTGKPGTYELVGLTINPPVLSSFSVKRLTNSGSERLWQHTRTQDAQGAWQRGMSGEGITLRNEESSGNDQFLIRISLNRPMHTLKVAYGKANGPGGEQDLKIKAVKGSQDRVFEGVLSVTQVEPWLSTNTVKQKAHILFRISGDAWPDSNDIDPDNYELEDFPGPIFDEDPDTLIRLDEDAKLIGWEYSMKRPGVRIKVPFGRQQPGTRIIVRAANSTILDSVRVPGLTTDEVQLGPADVSE